MSILRTVLPIGSSAAVGAAAAVCVVLCLASEERAAPVTDALAVGAHAAAESPQPRWAAAHDPRLTRAEREVAQLRDALDATGPAAMRADSPTPIDGIDEPLPDEQESLEQARQIWDLEVEAHEDALIDPLWSEQARARFEVELADALGESTGDIRVDCRRGSCLASVGFASYAEATTSFASLLQHPYSLNCETSLAMPPPDDPSATYRAEILFACPDELG